MTTTPTRHRFPGLDGRIAEALLAINEGDDRPMIPPTAINWIAPQIAEAVKGYYDVKVTVTAVVHGMRWGCMYPEALDGEVDANLHHQLHDRLTAERLGQTSQHADTLHLAPLGYREWEQDVLSPALPRERIDRAVQQDEHRVVVVQRHVHARYLTDAPTP